MKGCAGLAVPYPASISEQASLHLYLFDITLGKKIRNEALSSGGYTEDSKLVRGRSKYCVVHVKGQYIFKLIS